MNLIKPAGANETVRNGADPVLCRRGGFPCHPGVTKVINNLKPAGANETVRNSPKQCETILIPSFVAAAGFLVTPG